MWLNQSILTSPIKIEVKIDSSQSDGAWWMPLTGFSWLLSRLTCGFLRFHQAPYSHTYLLSMGLTVRISTINQRWKRHTDQISWLFLTSSVTHEKKKSKTKTKTPAVVEGLYFGFWGCSLVAFTVVGRWLLGEVRSYTIPRYLFRFSLRIVLIPLKHKQPTADISDKRLHSVQSLQALVVYRVC